jgi:hypothetical protein
VGEAHHSPDRHTVLLLCTAEGGPRGPLLTTGAPALHCRGGARGVPFSRQESDWLLSRHALGPVPPGPTGSHLTQPLLLCTAEGGPAGPPSHDRRESAGSLSLNPLSWPQPYIRSRILTDVETLSLTVERDGAGRGCSSASSPTLTRVCQFRIGLRSRHSSFATSSASSAYRPPASRLSCPR